MKKLVIICEGRTEANLVNNLLSEYFLNKFTTFPVTLPNGQNPLGGDSKGGWRSSDGYSHALVEIRDIISLHKQNIITTFFDLYRFPSDIPCYEKAKAVNDPSEKARIYESQLKSDILKLGINSNFFPYIQPYEFEAFLFADPEIAALEIANDENSMKNIMLKMQMVTKNYPTPEHINSGTPPSKKMQDIVPNFKRYKAGRWGFSWKIAKEIGIENIRERCRHFNDWICMLEEL